MRSGQTLVIFLLMVAASGSQATDRPQPDPPGQYRLIGGPAVKPACDQTPLCTVETLLACFARRDEALCRAVWPGMAQAMLFGAEQRRQAYWWSWRLEAVRLLGERRMELAVAGRHCGLLSQAEPVCRTTPAPATRYQLGWDDSAKAWRVLDWHSPTEAGVR